MYMGCRIGKEIFPMDKQIILPDEQPPSKPNKRRILLFQQATKKRQQRHDYICNKHDQCRYYERTFNETKSQFARNAAFDFT